MFVKHELPQEDLNRSEIACRIGILAAENDLFLSHYEYRVALESPDFWLPNHRADLLAKSSWENGILAENKYQSFRNDQRIGSFHPNHQAKWTSHELCHGLVGFAWKENASDLFHATAARLAELLPVVLYYFYDEIGLNRCVYHSNLSYPNPIFCPACEAMARMDFRRKDSKRAYWIEEGERFLQAELDAIRKTISCGRVYANSCYNLNLSSDSLAYVSMQRKRLQSPEFERYIREFFPENTGCFNSLEALEERLLQVNQALLDHEKLDAFSANRFTWISQDIAWRLIELQAQSEGDLFRELDKIISKLSQNMTEEAIRKTIDQYEELYREFHLPDPEDFFALGYFLSKGYGRSSKQIKEGLESHIPKNFSKMNALERDIPEFCREDQLKRQSLVHRFTEFVEKKRSLKNEFLSFEIALNELIYLDEEAESLRATVDEKNWRLNKTIRSFLLRKSELELFELFEAEDLDEENYILLRYQSGNEINIEFTEKWIYQFIRNKENFGKLNREQQSILIEQRIVIPKKWKVE